MPHIIVPATTGPRGPAGANGTNGTNGTNGKNATVRFCLALAAPGDIALGPSVGGFAAPQVWNQTTGADVSTQFVSPLSVGGNLHQSGTVGMTAGDSLIVSLEG